jgi:hypothetical protein
MNLYPEQLRRIANFCAGLNEVDPPDAPETAGVTLMLRNGIAVIDEDGNVYGYLADEIGGAWAFWPAKDNATWSDVQRLVRRDESHT